MTGTAPRVAVVGAGMAGLTAAHRLRQRGCAVTVFEATPRAGGMVRTVSRDGWTVDTGAITMATPVAEVAEVLDLAGVTPLLVAASPGSTRRYLVHRGTPLPVPTTPAEMVATPLLSVAGRLRMLKEPFVARGGVADETVAAFARRRFGEETAARFIDPLVAGTSGGDPELLLASFTFPRLVEFERRAGSVLKGRMRASREARRNGQRSPQGAWSARDGLGSVAERLAASLGADLRCGEPVTAVQVHDTAVDLVVAGVKGTRFDAVLLALPAPALAALPLAVPGAGQLAGLGRIPHASLATVSLGYPRDRVAHSLDGHGVLAATAEGRRVLGVSFTSTLFPDRAPAGHVLLTVTAGGVRHPDDVRLDDVALVELAVAECQSLLGAVGPPSIAEVARWPGAMPLAVAGHGACLAAATAVEEAVGRVALCGAWRDGLALGEVMRGGVAAADRLVARLGWHGLQPEEQG